MRSILVMCYSDPRRDPRPNRMINSLRYKYKVTVAAIKENNFEGMEIIPLPLLVSKSYTGKLVDGACYKLGLFEHVIWPRKMQQARDMLLQKNFDLIVSHDLNLLPLAFAVKKNAKVLFDAREYYTRHFEDRFMWRFFFQKFNEYLCENYIRKCDYMVTVCDGIALEYEKQYGIKSDILMSFPEFSEKGPSESVSNMIRIIHHGSATPSRRIETMIEMMDYLDERFSLELMLVPGERFYFKKLTRMADSRKNVKIILPVKYNEIIHFTNQYDIGLFFVPPSTFNLKYTLPNKLFEFIQARLAVAIGPSIEMKKVVEKYDCGVVAKDFNPKSLADELNKLTSEKIMYYKNQSHKAASELNAEKNCEKIRKIVFDLIGA